jgi:hypothetical protein
VAVTPVGGGAPVQAAVGAGGVVVLPRALRARGFRVGVLRAGGSSRPSVGVAEVRGPGVPRSRTATSGSLAGRCGQASAVIGGRDVAMRLGGSVASLNQGEPLTLTACGGPVSLPASPTEVTVGQGLVRPLLVSLRSPAPQPLAVAAGASASGTVTDAGHQDNGSYSDVRVRVAKPSWLVLGESYSPGWHASCNGRSLGPPQVIDAFANGWRVGPGCERVSISFAPQTDVDVGFLVGGAACAVLLLVLAFGRRGPPPAGEPEPAPLALPAAPRVSPGRAVAAGVAITLVAGFVFALRAGVVIGPVCALILWRGVPSRRIVQIAAGLLVIVVPLLYLLFPGINQGGYDIGYTTQHLGAHWVAAGAVALLLVALLRDLSMARRRGGDDPAAPPGRAARAPGRA